MRMPVVREIPSSMEPTTLDPFIESLPSAGPSEAGMRDADAATLVRAARMGDRRAWDELVRRFAPLLAGIARRFRLSPHDADDVAQTTWLRLLERGESLRDPEALPGWLATTARRECLRALQRGVREQLMDHPAVEGDAASAEEVALAAEARATLATAVATLPPRQRALVGSLLEDPGRSYKELGELVGAPVGSVGPTLMRATSRLRRDPRIAALGQRS